MVWLCLRWWVVLYKSWAILVSRMLRKWWSVRNRDGVILYACVVYFDCEYCGCYCFVVYGEVLVVVLLACHNSLLCITLVCSLSLCVLLRVGFGGWFGGRVRPGALCGYRVGL